MSDMKKNYGGQYNPAAASNQLGSGLNTAQREMTEADKVCQSMQNTIDTLNGLRNRIGELAARLGTSLPPQAVTNDKIKPSRAGVIGRISDQLENINAEISTSHDLISQIEQQV